MESPLKLAPMPTAWISFLPSHSGDGYGYGGGTIVSFGGCAIPFGEGGVACNLAKQVVRAVSAHDALVDAMKDAEAVIRARYSDEYQMLLGRIKDALAIADGHR